MWPPGTRRDLVALDDAPPGRAIRAGGMVEDVDVGGVEDQTWRLRHAPPQPYTREQFDDECDWTGKSTGPEPITKQPWQDLPRHSTGDASVLAVVLPPSYRDGADAQRRRCRRAATVRRPWANGGATMEA